MSFFRPHLLTPYRECIDHGVVEMDKLRPALIAYIVENPKDRLGFLQFSLQDLKIPFPAEPLARILANHYDLRSQNGRTHYAHVYSALAETVDAYSTLHDNANIQQRALQ